MNVFDHITAGRLPQGLQARLGAWPEAEPATALSRRSFVKLATASGFALGVVPAALHAQAQPTAAGLKPTQQPAAFVRIERDDSVIVRINRLEFGQGVQTGLPLILAEELDADWSRVRSEHGDSRPNFIDPVMGLHFTGGSSAIKNSYAQYRELGARARAMLVSAAATQWNVDPASLRTERGVVIGPGGKKLGYGELADAAMKLPVPDTVTLKDPKQFKLIGHATGRLDARAKSSGRQDYGIDMKLPGQLTAVIARPAVFGARIKSVDDAAARAVPGVKSVVRIPSDGGGEAVAVVATGYWAAKQGRDALKIDWDADKVDKVDSVKLLAQYQALSKTVGKVKYQADVSRLADAPNKISAEFNFPYLPHAPMEPLNCTVALGESGVEIWTGSQMPGVDTMAAAKTLGLKPEAVKLNVLMAGGGFGRRASPQSDFVVEACNVAKAARAGGLGAPIRTVWSREDDIKGGYYRPMHVHRAEIGFDAQGKVLAWDHIIVGQSILIGTLFEPFLVKDEIDGMTVEGMKEPYDVPMRLSVHHTIVNVPVLWWRSVGSTHTAYVMETLVDEIARATNQDPVAYRLKLIGDGHPRHRAALQLAVDKSGYGKRTLAAGRAWGVAVHESFNTVVAYVVEASVKDKVPSLHAITAGVHCNLAVNPLSVEAQVQGAALMGLSMCLPGAAVTLKDGIVEQSNFGDFVVPRINEMPTVAVHIVPSADAPTGMGEPGVPPLAPAFANAIAKLTGKTPRELPFKLG